MLNKEFSFIKKIYFYSFNLMAQIGAKNNYKQIQIKKRKPQFYRV